MRIQTSAVIPGGPASLGRKPGYPVWRHAYEVYDAEYLPGWDPGGKTDTKYVIE